MQNSKYHIPISWLGFFLVLYSCSKKENDFMVFNHTFPLPTDLILTGSVPIKLAGKSYVYFDKEIFPKFPSDFWLYLEPEKKFVPKADFPGKDRIIPFLIAYEQGLYGGLSKIISKPEHRDWYWYDTTSNVWSARTSSPYLIRNAMEATKSTTKIIFSCAYAINNIPLCSVIYDAKSDSWSLNKISCDSLRNDCF